MQDPSKINYFFFYFALEFLKYQKKEHTTPIVIVQLNICLLIICIKFRCRKRFRFVFIAYSALHYEPILLINIKLLQYKINVVTKFYPLDWSALRIETLCNAFQFITYMFMNRLSSVSILNCSNIRQMLWINLVPFACLVRALSSFQQLAVGQTNEHS